LKLLPASVINKAYLDDIYSIPVLEYNLLKFLCFVGIVCRSIINLKFLESV